MDASKRKGGKETGGKEGGKGKAVQPTREDEERGKKNSFPTSQVTPIKNRYCPDGDK